MAKSKRDQIIAEVRSMVRWVFVPGDPILNHYDGGPRDQHWWITLRMMPRVGGPICMFTPDQEWKSRRSATLAYEAISQRLCTGHEAE